MKKIFLLFLLISTSLISFSQGNNYLTLSDSAFNVLAAGSSYNFVQLQSNVAWTASCSQPWISLNENQGTGADSLSVHVAENTTTSVRQGTVVFKSADSSLIRYIYITQAAGAKSISVSSSQLQLIGSAQTQKISVSSNTNWIASSNNSWITINKSNGTGNDSITITVTKNTGLQTRTGSIKAMLSDNSNVNTVTIIQMPDTIQLLSTKDSLLHFEPKAGSKYLHISSNSSWNITNNNSWVQVNKTAGINNDSILISISENPTSSVRTATLTASLQDNSVVKTITIYQAASSTYLLVYDSIENFPAVPTYLTRMVSVQSNANWTASSSQSWVTLDKTRGVGTDSLGISVANNTANTVRSAVITLRTTDSLVTRYINITQAAGAKSISVSSSQLQLTGSTQTQKIKIASNTNWITSSNNSWITINKNNGTGDDSITITVTQNVGLLTRIGWLKVMLSDSSNVKIVTIIQMPDTTQQLLTKDSLINFESKVSSKYLQIGSNSCWNITKSNWWVQLSKVSGINSDSVLVSIQENPTNSVRTATLTASLQDGSVVKTITIQQAGCSTYLLVGNSKENFPAVPTYSTKTVSIHSNVSWTASSSQSWVILSKTKGDGIGIDSLGISVGNNTTNAIRSALITIRTTDSLVTKYIDISQAAASNSGTLAASQYDIQMSVNEETKKIAIESNSNWVVSNNNSWISINKSNGSGNDSLAITVAKNTGFLPRIGSINVILQDSSIFTIITIRQAGPTLAVVNDSLFFVANSAATQKVFIVNAHNTAYTYTGNGSWVSITKNVDSLFVSTTQNTSSSSRTCVINIYLSDTLLTQRLTQTLKIVQYGVVVKTAKSVSISAGALSSSLTSAEAKTVTELTISGSMDVRDFLFIRDSMPSLTKLNLSAVSIALYQGTIDSSLFKSAVAVSFPANTIPENALKGKTTLTEIVLPATLGAIESNAFSGCTNLKSVTLSSNPTVSSTAFDNVDKSTCAIVVPSALVNSYKSSSVWSQFSNIKEESTTEIVTTTTATGFSIYPNPTKGEVFINGISENAVIAVYDIKGLFISSEVVKGNKTSLLTNLPQGTYIIKVKDGKQEITRRLIKE